MAEFIGARISLVSKSDIRYVGILHEIDSEDSTVALEQVKCYGTEGRKANPSEEIPASDTLYDFIRFRGSDVKDLRIDEVAAVKENLPPRIPNDPAIMSSSARPPTENRVRQQAPSQAHAPPQAHSQDQHAPPPHGPTPPGVPPPFGLHNPQYPSPFYPPPPANWGRGGPAPFQGMPYGAPPPGWYPPPGQGFPAPPPGTFAPFGMLPPPPNPPFQQGQVQATKPSPIGPGAHKTPTPPSSAVDKQSEPKSLVKPAAEMPAAAVPEAPKESRTQAKPTPSAPPIEAAASMSKAQIAPKSNRVQPVIPLRGPAAPNTMLQPNASNASQSKEMRDATEAATAAVAAAMAKLPGAQSNGNGSALDNLTNKVNELRMSEPIRASREPAHAGDRAGFDRGRGRGRGGAPRTTSQKDNLPVTDFDFATSNAKFNKEDLVKEVIAGSPLGDQPTSPTAPDIPAPAYSKSTSFFDNISSESKDRQEANGGRPGGREWRGEEQKKNVETFGQGSVDNGYRGGFRGRGGGRGRGRGGFRGRGPSSYSGNGQPAREGGSYRGNRGGDL